MEPLFLVWSWPLLQSECLVWVFLSAFLGKARGKGGSFCSDSFLALSSLTSSSDLQCFTVKPVMNLPPNYKDKPVPGADLKVSGAFVGILACVSHTLYGFIKPNP